MQWSPADTLSVRAGQLLGGKYRLLEPVGQGGSGAVWSALHVELERTVAIKFLRRSALESAVARFVREAKSAARVCHRYVVDVFDAGVTDEGTHYMVQELLQGEELGRCIYDGPAWDVRDALRFVGQCLTALDVVHEHGLVHRDIKPENVFVARDSEGPFPKLLDFGTAELESAREVEARRRGKKKRRPEGPVARLVTEGTPAYMAPEQLRGLSHIDRRTDLYAVGVVLYEWLTGRRPYEQDTPEALCAASAAGGAVPLVLLRPDLGEALSALVMRALSPQADARFASALAMRDALLALVPDLPGALTVVQREESLAPIGTKTARLLTAAQSPFANDDSAPALRLPVRSPLWPLLAAAACLGLVGLGTAWSAGWLGRAEPRAGFVTTVPRAPRAVSRVSGGASNAQGAPSRAPGVQSSAPRAANAQSSAPPHLAQASTAAREAPPTTSQAEPLVTPARLALAAPPGPPRPARRALPALAKVKRARAPSAQVAPHMELGEVRLEVASQSAHPSEPLLEERELTGQDLRRLGL